MRCLALGLAAAALLAGCSGTDQGTYSPENSSGLSDYLPAAPGFQLPAKIDTQQVLDTSEAAKALPSGADATEAELASLHFRSGFARVWGNAFDYVTMVVLALPTPTAATAFVAFERQSLSGAQNTFVNPHADIPGSFVFVISSPTQASGNQDAELCNGVWFSYQAYAFESLACGSTPSWATQIEEAAKALYGRARQKSA